MWSTLIVHVLTCIWYFIACLINGFTSSWISNYSSNSTFENYITSLYYVISILTTSGSASITPTNDIEKVFTIVLMLAAHIMFAILVGRTINCLFCATSIQEKYKKKINNFNIYLKTNNISENTINNVMLYINRLWHANNGEQMPSAIQLINNATQKELMFNIYGYLLKNSMVFADTGDIFLKHLCQHLTCVFYFSGDYIVQEGDFDKSMYFIHKGKVKSC